MKTAAEMSCIQSEIEYREWSECPQWYCVKTTYHNNGKIEAEIVADEKSKIPLVLQQMDKPMDGVFETASSVAYYTYHRGYEEAAKVVAAVKNIGKAS